MTFTYDAIHSEKYGLFICNLDMGMKEETGETHSIVKHIPQRTHAQGNTFLGYEPSPPCSFEMTIASETPIDAFTSSQIIKWLVRREKYCKLRILQSDRHRVSYNCIFTSYRKVYIGNFAYAIILTAECDSPYQHGTSRSISRDVSAVDVFDIRNDSDINDFIYPTASIKMSPSGGNISIINTDDIGSGGGGAREFSFTGLSGDEYMVIDNRNKMITSSTGINRLPNFNKKWLRLISGTNEFWALGAASITITYESVKRIGV